MKGPCAGCRQAIPVLSLTAQVVGGLSPPLLFSTLAITFWTMSTVALSALVALVASNAVLAQPDPTGTEPLADKRIPFDQIVSASSQRRPLAMF